MSKPIADTPFSWINLSDPRQYKWLQGHAARIRLVKADDPPYMIHNAVQALINSRNTERSEKSKAAWERFIGRKNKVQKNIEISKDTYKIFCADAKLAGLSHTHYFESLVSNRHHALQEIITTYKNEIRDLKEKLKPSESQKSTSRLRSKIGSLQLNEKNLRRAIDQLILQTSLGYYILKANNLLGQKNELQLTPIQISRAHLLHKRLHAAYWDHISNGIIFAENPFTAEDPAAESSPVAVNAPDSSPSI